MLHLLEIMLPIFIIIFCGFFFGKKTVGDHQAKALNMFVYYFAFPSLIICGLIDKNLSEIFYLPFILGYLGASMVVFIIGVLLGGKKIDYSHKILIGLSASFPNCGYIGIPLVSLLFGSEVLLPAIVATVLSLMHLTMVVFILEFSQKQVGRNFKQKMFKALKSSIFNPLIFCFILGLLILALKIELPKSLSATLHLLAGSCSPCALFGIGHLLAITKKTVGLNFRPIMNVFWLKNIFHAFLTWFFLYLLKIDTLWVVVGVLMASSSTGFVLPILAVKYKAYENEAPQAVFMTTVASLIILALWIFLLQIIYPDLLWL